MIKKLLHFLFVVLILAFIFGVPCAWMLYRSYNDPEVHYFYTKQGSGKDSAQSLRFAILSDLHGYVFEGGNGVIADLVSNTFPDAILIDGNLIDGEKDEITESTDLIKRLSQIAPVYYSYAEQELRYVQRHSTAGTAAESADPLRDALEKAGAVVLNEEFADTQLYGIPVRIGGMNGNAYELTNPGGDVKRNSEKAYKMLTEFVDSQRLKIMLSNRTQNFLLGDACDRWKIDLIVSGDLCGGLVVVPHYGGLFGGAQGRFPEYVHGIYEKGNCKLLLTSGLSAPTGSSIPRFNNPPEIAILDVDGLERQAEADAPKDAKSKDAASEDSSAKDQG